MNTSTPNTIEMTSILLPSLLPREAAGCSASPASAPTRDELHDELADAADELRGIGMHALASAVERARRLLALNLPS